jgi:cell division protein FtsL
MVDLANGVEVRNYGLKRTPDPKGVRESLMLFLPVAIVACAFSFQIWIRCQTISVGYQMQELQSQWDELLRNRQQLVVEEQTVKNPEWLDQIAGKNLGMVVVRPAQIIPASIKNLDADNSKTTLMGNLVGPYVPDKSSSFERP